MEKVRTVGGAHFSAPGVNPCEKWVSRSKPNEERDRASQASKIHGLFHQAMPDLVKVLKNMLLGSATKSRPAGQEVVQGRSPGSWLDIVNISKAKGRMTAECDKPW